jgi:TonB family protein
MPSDGSPARYRFGPFELQLDTRRLLRNGEAVAVRPRDFDLLATMVERARVLRPLFSVTAENASGGSVDPSPAPATVAERRSSTLELHGFQPPADAHRMSAEHKQLTLALLLSLLFHAWVMSLALGGWRVWLPGLGFPWDRPIEAPALRVVVVPPVTAVEPPVTPLAEPLQQALVEQPVASVPAPTRSVSRAPTPRRTTAAIVPQANPKAEAGSRTEAATSVTSSEAPVVTERPGDIAPPPLPTPPVIALSRIDEPRWVVPATPAMLPTPVMEAVPTVSNQETAMPSPRDAGVATPARSDQAASARAVESAKVEASKQEEQRKAEQLEATRQEAAQAEKARVEAERAEAARVEAARAEAARVEAARVEAARVEAARVEAARVEAARVEAARVEAARIEAARIEAARVEAARIEAARVEAAQEAAARREAALRAIGRQLDEEAARREGANAEARQSPSLPPSWSSARRYRLFGRTDPNAELIQYAEAWARKIQLNTTTFDMVREPAKLPHTDPLVWVAIRSDGSVESVTFVYSSGAPALDEAIRRVVHSQKPYQPFPPGLAREFDVIEIRRTWHFDVAIRLD